MQYRILHQFVLHIEMEIFNSHTVAKVFNLEFLKSAM